MKKTLHGLYHMSAIAWRMVCDSGTAALCGYVSRMNKAAHRCRLLGLDIINKVASAVGSAAAKKDGAALNSIVRSGGSNPVQGGAVMQTDMQTACYIAPRSSTFLTFPFVSTSEYWPCTSSGKLAS